MTLCMVTVLFYPHVMESSRKVLYLESWVRFWNETLKQIIIKFLCIIYLFLLITLLRCASLCKMPIDLSILFHERYASCGKLFDKELVVKWWRTYFFQFVTNGGLALDWNDFLIWMYMSYDRLIKLHLLFMFHMREWEGYGHSNVAKKNIFYRLKRYMVLSQSVSNKTGGVFSPKQIL